VPDIELDPEISTALYRIFQEGLTNIAKHAHATAIEATLFANASMVTLEIRDDGRGVDPSQLDKTGSFGVFGMLERVRNLGGWLEIESPHGQGTTLMASLPLRVAPGKAA
jgi:signal transduction histidine kinase